MYNNSVFRPFRLSMLNNHRLLVRTRERFMGIGQVLMMPLFFVEQRHLPDLVMPVWLRAISHFNPITYYPAHRAASLDPRRAARPHP